MTGPSKITALLWTVLLACCLTGVAASATEVGASACPAGQTCPATGPAPSGAAASVGEPRPTAETPVKTAVAKKNNTLRWNIQNRSGRRVELQLYSQNRNWVWPSANRVYVLPNSKKSTINISCRKNEKICYGAWVAGNTRSYWGVGYDGRRDCRGCCYICGRGQTPVIKLLW
jgi:hypothetical protein